jgi:D-serine dehydratase
MTDVSNYQSGMADGLDKGLGALERPIAPGQTRGLGWRLLAEEVSLPAAVLYESNIEHNLRWMQSFVEAYGLKLAPHGKTTMAPKLFRRQLDGGAWGITVATAQQARVAAHYGVQRVLMANQLVGKRNIAIVAELLERPGFTFYCLVDSVDGVEQLARELAARGAVQPMSVLLEIGPTADQSGSRTGVSDEAQLEEVLAALQRHATHVRLAGVELYEGILKEEGEIRVFLRRSIGILQRIASGNGFADGAAPILSGAGSAWYDVVAEEFAQASFARPVDLVLRPGCYLTHDVGIYRAAQSQIQQRNPVAARMREGLKPALQLWAYVQSIPRRDRAVIALGKRDAAFDSGYPEPSLHFRPGSASQDKGIARPIAAPSHWKVTGMMDQHAYMTIAEGDDLRVGDMIAFDISHPCLTFDKWRHLLLLDDDYRCIDLVETFF